MDGRGGQTLRDYFSRCFLLWSEMSANVRRMETSISVIEYAKAIKKTSRAVHRWIKEGVELPPPAIRVWGGVGTRYMIVVDQSWSPPQLDKEN